MAMTAQVKAELASTQVTKSCCRKSEVSSMLRFAGGLHIVSGRIVNLHGDSLVVSTDGPSLLAEVLDERDELVVPAFSIPTPEPR